MTAAAEWQLCSMTVSVQRWCSLAVYAVSTVSALQQRVKCMKLQCVLPAGTAYQLVLPYLQPLVMTMGVCLADTSTTAQAKHMRLFVAASDQPRR